VRTERAYVADDRSLIWQRRKRSRSRNFEPNDTIQEELAVFVKPVLSGSAVASVTTCDSLAEAARAAQSGGFQIERRYLIWREQRAIIATGFATELGSTRRMSEDDGAAITQKPQWELKGLGKSYRNDVDRISSAVPRAVKHCERE
jgi:hypothetical protein